MRLGLRNREKMKRPGRPLAIIDTGCTHESMTRKGDCGADN